MSTREERSTPLNAVVRPPESLTQSVQVARVLWLRSLFGSTQMAKASESTMDTLAARMTEYFVPRGTPLYQEGSASNSLYFIVEGTIQQGTTGYHRFVSGDVLGFVDAMIDRPHLKTAQVIEDAVVLRLKQDDWLEFLEDDFQTLRGLILASLRNVGVHPDELPEDSAQLCRRLCAEQSKETSADFVRLLLVARLSPLFRLAGIQAIAQVVRGARPIRLESGEEWTDMPQSPGICLVTSGSVRVEFAEEGCEAATTHRYETGQLVASIHGLVERFDACRVKAEVPAELLHLNTETFFNIMEDHFELARSVLSYLARRVELANARALSTEK